MESENDATLVPVQLTIGGRTGVTLWAPPWIEDGEEWQAFLGNDDQLMVFDNPDALAKYLPRAVDNDLSDHPAWELYQTLPAAALAPDDDFRFDYDAAPDLVEKTPAKGPYDDVVSTLGDLVDLAQRIAECTEDGPMISMLDTSTFADLVEDADEDTADWDEEDWQELVAVLDRAWPLLVDRLAARLAWSDPEAVETAAVTPMREGPAAAGSPAVGATHEPAADDATAGALSGAASAGARLADPPDVPAARAAAADTAAAEPRSSAQFWEDVGMAPVAITLSGDTGYTLRCFTDDAAVFLGSDLEIDVFRSAAGLVSYCRSAEVHDLYGFDTWPKVQAAAELDVTPLPEDRYDLGADSPAARELAGDIAGYCELAAVQDRLDEDPGSDDPGWADIVGETASCLRWHD